MRRTTTLAALLLGTTVLAPTGLANAVGETCRGEAATIVGTREYVQGTEGRDVIVTGTAQFIESSGGHDLICITGSSASVSVSVNAGTGDDTVDGSAFAGTSHTSVILGDGADTFVGSRVSDSVDGGDRSSAGTPVLPDNERDVIDSGGGDDRVSSGGMVPNPDVVTAGPGNDVVLFEGPMAPGGRLDGGDGDDSLSFAVEEGALAVYAAQGTARLDLADWMGWSGMENLSMSLGRVDLGYTGSDDGESLSVSAVSGEPTVDATLGRGDDDVSLSGVVGRTVLDAGAGRDTLKLFSTSRVRADLRKRTFTLGPYYGHRLDGIENVSAFGSGATLFGDDRRNVLVAGPCSARIVGAGGRDDLSRDPWPDSSNETRCSTRRATEVFTGGAGNDTIDGSRKDDILRGGPGNDRIVGRQGRDTAVGGPGRDQCKTEIARSCER